MITKQFFLFATFNILCCAAFNIAHAKDTDSLLLPISIKLDTSMPITVKPDFSGVGDDLGNGVGKMFLRGAGSFADAMKNKEYGDNMSRGMSGLADNLGNSFNSFNTNAEQNFFPELGRTFKGFVGSAINKNNVFHFGGLVALSFVVSYSGYYLTKFLWEFLSYKVFNPKPVILLPGTKYGRWDRVKQWWKGYKTPSMISDSRVKDRLLEIVEKTKNIRSHNRTRKNRFNKMAYDNLLLHGKPGTGKTLFAKVLSDLTDMDFVATTAASLLQSGVSGVKYFNDMIRMARKSSYGLIIFIDEADALFVDRDSLDPDSDHYKILSHILALTGDGNSDFMLVAATNHSYVMDSAMGRRFQDRVLMPLPDEQTRKELIDLYVEKIFFNSKTNTKQFVKSARMILNNTIISQLVEQTIGFSHAEIKDLIHALHKKVYACAEKSLTISLIQRTMNEAIEKKNALKKDKKKRKNNTKL